MLAAGQQLRIRDLCVQVSFTPWQDFSFGRLKYGQKTSVLVVQNAISKNLRNGVFHEENICRTPGSKHQQHWACISWSFEIRPCRNTLRVSYIVKYVLVPSFADKCCNR